MKDPAALLYIDKWLSATAEMDADCRGWYMNLILHQYDKGSLPDDIEKLALLAGVRFSEYERFNQVFNQVLNQKFQQNGNGRLENDFAKEILRKRERFTSKRTRSANIAVVIKKARAVKGISSTVLSHLKDELNEASDERIESLKDNQLLNQMVNQLNNLYINKDKDINRDIDVVSKGGVGENFEPDENLFPIDLGVLPIGEIENEVLTGFTMRIARQREIKNIHEGYELTDEEHDDYAKKFFAAERGRGKTFSGRKQAFGYFFNSLSKHILEKRKKMQQNDSKEVGMTESVMNSVANNPYRKKQNQ